MRAKLTEEQKTAYSFAIEDMRDGCNTLWVNRLRKEDPELYEYAKKRIGVELPEPKKEV